MVVYYKLFDLLKRRNMKISDLRGVISSATVAKLNKGQHISGECIDKICRYLQCQPNDIMEIIENESEKAKREKLENAVTKSAEQIYKLILKMAEIKNISPREAYNIFLDDQQDKNDMEFQSVRKYIESRLNENQTK